MAEGLISPLIGKRTQLPEILRDLEAAGQPEEIWSRKLCPGKSGNGRSPEDSGGIF